MNEGLQPFQIQVKQFLSTTWQRRRLVVSVAWVAAIVTAPLAMLAPNYFEASAKIYVDTQTVLKPLLAGLTYQPDIEQQLRMLARTIISRPNVERLVDRPELGVGVDKASSREKTVTRLMDQIKIAPSGAGNLYAITFKDRDSVRALKVVDATLDLFVNTGAYGKKRDSQEAGEFIEEQIKDYEGKLVAAENRLKEFKVKNFGTSGVSNQDYFARVSVLTEEVSKLQVDLHAAEQARDAFRRELAGENPQLPPEAGKAPASPAEAELDARLEVQKKQLDDLLRRYTEQHPDVASTRRVIAQIEAQRRQLAEARAQAVRSGVAPADAATSPVYQKLRISLAETEAQVASLRAQLSAKQARLNDIRAVAGRAPVIEAELAQLNRDYDIMRKKYDELVSRRESAALTVKLDEASKLADFRVIEPPRVSPSPVFPGRLHIAMAAVLASLLAGLCAPAVMDLLHPTFRDLKALQAATGRPVLGRITLAISDEARRQMRSTDTRLATALAGLLLAQIAWLAWIASRGGL